MDRFISSIILIVFLQIFTSGCLCASIASTFQNKVKHSRNINSNLVVHKETGFLYLGAINTIFKLDPDLQLINSTVTVKLSCSTIRLSEPDCPNYEKRSEEENWNKILVIDYTGNKIVYCGNRFQGACYKSSLNDFQNSEVIDSVIVSNDALSSSAAFIAPGPPIFRNSEVLYVGAAQTNEYWHEVPAVSSRSLHRENNLTISFNMSDYGTKMYIAANERGNYIINYIFGFSSEGFSYFLTNQKTVLGNPFFVAKLTRVCQNDSHYYSYTEIPIECSGSKFRFAHAAFVGKPGADLASKLGIGTQEDVLFVVFRIPNPNSNGIPHKTGLCVYSLRDIRKKFVENIDKCFQGKGNRGLGHIATDSPCTPMANYSINDDFCGVNYNIPLGGDIPIYGISIYNSSKVISAISVTQIGKHTIAFLGTVKGHLKKLIVGNLTQGSEYHDMPVAEGYKIFPPMQFDINMTHIYIMTQRKVFKVQLHDCSEYFTCEECVAAGDPYCGWCGLQNSCTLENDCAKGTDRYFDWISFEDQCVGITMVKPNQTQISKVATLLLSVDRITEFKNLWCVFNFPRGESLKTEANSTSSGVVCESPTTSDLPILYYRQTNYTAILTVRLQEEQQFYELVSTEFVFYDCKAYVTCTSCVSSDLPCNWCVEERSCFHDDSVDQCHNGTLVVGKTAEGLFNFHGPEYCPRINTETHGSPQILVPYGTSKKIEVKIQDAIIQIIGNPQFACRFHVEESVINVGAQYYNDNSTIVCDAVLFNRSSDVSDFAIPFEVIWQSQNKSLLDNPTNIHILVYRCFEKGNICGSCLTTDVKYNCGWCHSSQVCEVKEQCEDGLGVWLDRNSTCPDVAINYFRPLSGPWEGGTNVSIHGINLGKRYETYDAIGTHAKSGPLKIKLKDYKPKSGEIYHFVNPFIKEISPSKGPIAGGTVLTIQGQYLDCGNRLEVFVGSIPCNVSMKNVSTIECRVGKSKKEGTHHIVVRFDEHDRSFVSGFSFVENPYIIYEKIAEVRGISAGGINVIVKGRNFATIQKSYLYVIYKGVKHYGLCNILSSEEMNCLTPELDVSTNFKSSLYLKFGFDFDSVLYPAIEKWNNSFHLYPNPHYNMLKKHLKAKHGDYIVLHGTNLDSVFDESNLNVLIGNKSCNVTSVEKTQLKCKLPNIIPEELSTDMDPIKVVVGNYVKNIGYIRYNGEFQANTNYASIVGIPTVSVVCFLLVTLTGIYHKMKLKTVLGKRERDEFLYGRADASLENCDNAWAVNAYDESFEIEKQNMFIFKDMELGSGQFGIVYKGKVFDEEVAVKTTKSGCDKIYVMALLAELKVMIHIGQHNHVVCLVGARTKEMWKGEVYVAIQLLKFGSLQTHLRSRRSDSVNNYANTQIQSGESEDYASHRVTTVQDLLKWSYQIANGMAYLGEKKVVHGDLATRNVLLSEDWSVKISDFGLSRKVYEYGVYTKQSQEPLPWRWMSIEALEVMSFSTKSDVWAFGVTIWEIYSFGMVPYPGMSWTVDFLDKLSNGLRLTKPQEASVEIYELMLTCWHEDPDRRASFSNLNDYLYNLLIEISSDITSDEAYEMV